MENLHQGELQAAIEKIDAVRAELAKTVTDPVLGNVRMRIDSDLLRIQGYLGGLANTTVQAGTTVATLGPVTEVLGREIQHREAINREDLRPSEDEREQFIARRNALRAGIHGMTDDDVFALQHQPNGEALIRSLAKEAGIADYKELPVNVDYLANLRQAITKQDAVHKAEQEAFAATESTKAAAQSPAPAAQPKPAVEAKPATETAKATADSKPAGEHPKTAKPSPQQSKGK